MTVSRPKLLFLAHRIPYPPTKGEKLRAFHLIRGLGERYDVHVGAPVDDPEDWRHCEAMAVQCHESCFVDARGRSRKRAGIEAIARGEPVTFSYFRHRALMRWVAEATERHAFDAAVLYSSGTAPYLDAIRQRPGALIVDFVDVDSEKWAEMGRKTPGAMGKVYAREARMLRDVERDLARRADAGLLVTEAEAALFRRVTGVERGIHAIGNGVDLAAWQGAHALPSPYGDTDTAKIIFTGAMDYAPNIEAVTWFAKTVMPLLRSRGRKTRFVIAGSNPDRGVQALGGAEDIHVTGRVQDMRPWLAHADIAVAPLKLARGVQNKVLEAMATGVPAVVTRNALEGIAARNGQSAVVAEDGPEFARAICELLDTPELARAIAQEAQTVIQQQYGWPARIAELHALIDAAQAGARSAA